MMDVSPGQAARVFHTVEVNLNQTTKMVGYIPATARVNAVDSKPTGKGSPLPDQKDDPKGNSLPSSPLKPEGPAPSRNQPSPFRC